MGFLDFIPVVGDVISGLFDMGATSMNNNAQKELAKYNWDQQKEMWNMNNAYNTPTAQMKRFADAGLNPNLIYGTGASAGNSSYTPSGPQMPNLRPFKSPNFGASLAQVAVQQNLRAQNDNLKKQNEVLEADKSKKLAETVKIASDTKMADYDLSYKKLCQDLNYNILQNQADNLKLTGTGLDLKNRGYELDNKGKELNNNFLEQTLDYRVQQEFEKLQIDRATKLRIGVETKLVAAKIGLTHAQTNLTLQQAVTETFKQENIRFDSNIKKNQGLITSIEASIKAITKPEAIEAIRQGNQLNFQKIVSEELKNLLTSKEVATFEFSLAADICNKLFGNVSSLIGAAKK